MSARACCFIIIFLLFLTSGRVVFSADHDPSSAKPVVQPRFEISAATALAREGVERSWMKDESFGLVVTIRNISDQEQILMPCSSGIWLTDADSLYIESANPCAYDTAIKLPPHQAFPGSLSLNVRLVGWNSLHTTPKLPPSFRVGILPASVAFCDAIVHGSSGQCGDANTSWSNPIPLSR